MKRPWNRTNSSVYSLVTRDIKNQLNMNICTYVSVVNMNPRSYVIAIDYQTKTYENLTKSNNKVVLQALSINNMKLIKKLGKQSGKDINKEIFLKKNNYFGIANITFPYRRFVPTKLVYSVLFFYYHEKLQLKLLLS